MEKKIELPFFTLILLISFPSVNAILYTPALPGIAKFFGVSANIAQYTITAFLLGYTVSQLLYGPIANRFGRKPTLYFGISLQIISSLICVLAGFIHQYPILVLGRFMVALGAGVGFKMTFTLIHECYDLHEASQKISYLILAFAITPGLGVALGGLLTTHFGWMGCFYAGAIYGILLLGLTTFLPETQKIKDFNALKIKNIVYNLGIQFKNSQLVAGGLLMGASGCFIYIFAALSPFIAIDIYEMNSLSYGIANIIPPIGLALGSFFSARLSKTQTPAFAILLGMMMIGIGVLLMLLAIFMKLSVIIFLFAPMIIIYFGLSPVFANAPILAMSHAVDASNASSVMTFINLSFITLIVLSLEMFQMQEILLPIYYSALCCGMILMLYWAVKRRSRVD